METRTNKMLLMVTGLLLVVTGMLLGLLVSSPATAGGPEPEEEALVKVGRPMYVPAGGFRTSAVKCPKGHEALGGGVDTQNAGTMTVTSSAPVFGDTELFDMPRGKFDRATGWLAIVRSTDTEKKRIVVAVICSKN
jgi:hypothetical protein